MPWRQGDRFRIKAHVSIGLATMINRTIGEPLEKSALVSKGWMGRIDRAFG
uniref:Uncharacterized protein n=1 Tax=Candidatus Kentrum sp. TC TaxID=2126339 RepID=A0A450YNJ1_9GAMM|nr:MAG: hypothetical protein BECKTC1821D_GA0114238_101512 [Candidatus Kentron sp. TC]